jgi:ankyrin repeat protein
MKNPLNILVVISLNLLSVFSYADSGTQAFQAIKTGDLPALTLMLDSGLNPNLKDANGDSLVIYSLRFNQPKIKDLLCSKGASEKICTTPYDDKESVELRGILGNKTATIDKVKELLSAGADPSYSKQLGSDWVYPPLIGAVFNNNIQIAQILISYGANINSRTSYQGKDYQQDTALAWATEENQFDMAKLFLDYGADPAIGFSGIAGMPNTTYSAAVYKNDPALLELLLSHTDQAQTKSLLTDLVCKIPLINDQITTVFPIYLKYKADINFQKSPNSVVRCIAYEKNLDAVKSIVSFGADPSLVSNIFDYNYSSNLTDEVFNYLVSKGAKACLQDLFDGAEYSQTYLEKIIPIMRKDELFMGNAPIWSPFIYADGGVVCSLAPNSSNRVAFDAIVRAGFDVDAPFAKPLQTSNWEVITPTLLEYCAQFPDIRQRLLKGGANPNKLDSTSKYTPLFLINFGNYESAEDNHEKALLADLLTAGGDPNLMTTSGYNAAQFFVKNRVDLDVDHIGILKKFGTQFSALAKDGRSFLHLYLFHKSLNLDVVKALVNEQPEVVKLVARINLNMNISGIPLFLALDSNNPEVVQYLVEAGSDINAQTNSKDTPLHALVFNFDPASRTMFEYLLKLNAKTDVKDWYGMTVRESALKQRRQDLIDLLNKYGK